jgi:hypothetical protein
MNKYYQKDRGIVGPVSGYYTKNMHLLNVSNLINIVQMSNKEFKNIDNQKEFNAVKFKTNRFLSKVKPPRVVTMLSENNHCATKYSMVFAQRIFNPTLISLQ